MITGASFITLLTFCILSIQGVTDGAKILALFPFPGPSQYILVQPYLKTLAAKGHEVSVVNAFPQKQKIKNYRDIPVLEVHDNYADLIAGIAAERNKWEDMSHICDFFANVTESVLKNPHFQQMLRTEHFDLVIMEVLHTDALYSLGRHFNAPMIGLSSYGTDPVIDELMGNISPFSYTPLVTIGFTERMSYRERMKNVIYQLLELLHVRLVVLPKQEKLLRKYMPHIKDDIWDMRTDFSLLLLNQHFSLSFPRPYVPGMVEVGGFQINYQSQPLPQEMLNFIESSNEDVIYFSMGSNIKSKDFSPHVMNMVIDVFRQLPYKIMWKFENSELPGKPKNVFISSWFPQPDVLAHPRVKLFISHGGLLSTTESVYHGKPMLGLPVFYDQQTNIKKATQAGFALGIEFKDINRDQFMSNIIELMRNPIYSQRAKEISTRYKDQPMKPLDLAIYWTEYVMRHKGAKHLQTVSQKMNFIQKHSIDTVGVLIVGVVIAVVLIVFIMVYLCKLISYKKVEKQKEN